MRILVAGATGALGRQLAPGLVAAVLAPEGIVLRYGTFYGLGASDVLRRAGPGTGRCRPPSLRDERFPSASLRC